MYKDIFEKFEEMQERGQISDFVDSKLKDIFIEEVSNNSLIGWRYDVLLDANGLSVVGPLNQGSMTMYQSEDNVITIAYVPCSIEIDENIVDLDYLDEKDEKELIKKIMLEENLETVQEVYDEIFNFDIDGYFREVNMEKYDEMVKDYIEQIWGNYYRDKLIDEIYDNVYMEKCYMESKID